MEHEELTPRVANLENQINMIAAMMAEIKAMMTATQVKSSNAPEANPFVNPNTSTGSDINQTASTEPEREAPPRALPVVVDLEKEKKEKPSAKTEEDARRLAKIEECLSNQGYELARFDKITPFAKIEVPAGYKEPEFVRKYDGTGCPRAHLKYYLRKMAHYSDYVPLLMNTFQESLSGAALAWFIELDMEEYDSWEDLAEEFLHQYKFNTATAPTREDLLRTLKGRNESIRTFAQRWRAIATQVKSAIPEEELVDLFLKTLPLEYFEKLNTSGCQTFAHLIRVAERHEWALREKRVPEPSFKRPYPTKRERENAGDVAFVPNPPRPKKFSESTPTQGGSSGPAPKKFEAKRRTAPSFTPLPRPLSKLLPMLLEGRLVAKEPPRPNLPRFPGFNEAQSCAYHMGEKGHNVDNCLVLKYKVQALIDGGVLEFDKTGPNVQQNPLPDHEKVNAIWDENDMDELELMAEEPPCTTNEDDLVAVIESKAPFVIRLDEVDKWGDTKSSSSERTVISLSGFKLEDRKAQYDGKVEKIVIKVPPLADYNPRAVPWDYGTSEIDAVMRSGRCYAPREGEPERREVTREDAEKALSIVRTSEFEVIEQLRKMPAQISLLDLFTNSEKHKNALMKVLNEVHVPETINEVQLEDFVGTILLRDQISFSDEDVPIDGWAHNKALYISARSHGKQISHVLIDNGSAFNICPLATLRNLGINEELIRTSKATIRAFDGMRKDVVGEIELDIFIGPVEFSIGFQVMDLPSAFGLLLGRPWIHTAGAVPSSLHQKVRFVVDGKVVTVHGEMDFATYQKSAIPYIEPERKEEASYHSLELVAVTHAPPGTRKRVPAPSQYTLAPGKMLLAYGFVPGCGLGKNGQGIRSPLQLDTNEHRSGLGYTGGFSSSFISTGYRGRRGRGQYRGRGSQGGRVGSFIGSGPWKGRASVIGSPLAQYFSKRPKMLADETVQNAAEPDLSNPFLEDIVNVIIERLDEDSSQPV